MTEISANLRLTSAKNVQKKEVLRLAAPRGVATEVPRGRERRYLNLRKHWLKKDRSHQMIVQILKILSWMIIAIRNVSQWHLNTSIGSLAFIW